MSVNEFPTVSTGPGLYRKGEAAIREAAVVIFASAWGVKVSHVWVMPTFGIKNPCRWTGGATMHPGTPAALPYSLGQIRNAASNMQLCRPTQSDSERVIRHVLERHCGTWKALAKALRYRGNLCSSPLRAYIGEIQAGCAHV